MLSDPADQTDAGGGLRADSLMLSGGDPGKEILYPVAVVIFGGLISSTLLDTVLTPLMFYRWGEKPLKKLLAQGGQDNY